MMVEVYKGDDITIHKWTNGCEVVLDDSKRAIAVRSLRDAKAICESLGRYIETFGED